MQGTIAGSFITGFIDAAAPSTAYFDAVIADSPVGYYRLNESAGDALDESGNGNDLTVSGTLTRSESGLISVGDSYRTVDADITSTDIDHELVGDTTVECWIYLDAYNSGNTYLFARTGISNDSSQYNYLWVLRYKRRV